MNTKLLQARQAIQNAREAFRSGDRNAARRWAEQATKLAPQLEDPWLILAAVASPRASMTFIERALQVNPDSPRAQRGMQWALKRLQETSSGETAPTKRTPAKVSGRNTGAEKVKRGAIFPSLLLALGCFIVLFAAWTASSSPALASILAGVSQPTQIARPKGWAPVEIAKPTYTPGLDSVLAEAAPTLSPPTPTLAPPTSEPTQPPTQEPTVTLQPVPTATPEEMNTPGVLAMEVLADTPTPQAPPTSSIATSAPPQASSGSGGEHWIEVNLTQQRVYAWEGSTLVNSFLVSTGTWLHPTVTGTFSIWNKTRIQAMSGPGYYLPNVPYVMYFYQDYGFHGTYWHNNFGTPMSHGCVNLTIPDSEWLYNWASYGTIVKVHY